MKVHKMWEPIELESHVELRSNLYYSSVADPGLSRTSMREKPFRATEPCFSGSFNQKKGKRERREKTRK